MEKESAIEVESLKSPSPNSNTKYCSTKQYEFWNRSTSYPGKDAMCTVLRVPNWFFHDQMVLGDEKASSEIEDSLVEISIGSICLLDPALFLEYEQFQNRNLEGKI